MACDDDLTSLADDVNEKLSPALEASCGLAERLGARYNQRRTVRDLARNFLGIPLGRCGTRQSCDPRRRKKTVGWVPRCGYSTDSGSSRGFLGERPRLNGGGGVTTSPPKRLPGSPRQQHVPYWTVPKVSAASGRVLADFCWLAEGFARSYEKAPRL